MPSLTGESFTDFYPAAYPELFAQLYAYSGDWAAARDAAEEALSRAWPRWRMVASLGDPRGWVARVGYRVVSRRARSARGESAIGADEPVRAMSLLPESQRRALAMSHLGGFSVGEIAFLEGVSEGSVTARLARARQALEAAFGSSNSVDAVLDRLRATVTTTVVAPELGAIEERVARRRMRRLIVGVVALVVVCAAAVLAGSLRGDRGTPSVTPSASPTSPDSAPTAPPGPAGVGRRDPAAGIEAGFLDNPLLGEAGATPDRYEGVLGGCEGDLIVSLSVAGGVGPQGAPVRISLYLYPDETSAHKAFRWIAAFPLACIGVPRARVVEESWHPLGDESAPVTFTPLQGGPAQRFLLVRANRTIVTVDAPPGTPATTATATVTSPPATVASSLDVEALAERLLARLCLYAGDGCARAESLPAPLGELTPDGEAWLVMVPDSGVAQERGRAVAALAELGYHPSLVSTGCDVGDGIATGADRYLALYFAREDEARALAAILPRDGRFGETVVAPVRTECVAGNRA